MRHSGKKNANPVSFAIVVAGLIALFIFFGAWAVSVDAAEHDRELSFALGNAGSSFGVNPLPSETNDQATAKATNGDGSSADTWWEARSCYPVRCIEGVRSVEAVVEVQNLIEE